MDTGCVAAGPRMPSGCHGPAVAALDDRVLVTGGSNQEYVAKSSTVLYDPNARTWSSSGLLTRPGSNRNRRHLRWAGTRRGRAAHQPRPDGPCPRHGGDLGSGIRRVGPNGQAVRPRYGQGSDARRSGACSGRRPARMGGRQPAPVGRAVRSGDGRLERQPASSPRHRPGPLVATSGGALAVDAEPTGRHSGRSGSIRSRWPVACRRSGHAHWRGSGDGGHVAGRPRARGPRDQARIFEPGGTGRGRGRSGWSAQRRLRASCSRTDPACRCRLVHRDATGRDGRCASSTRSLAVHSRTDGSA